jgi:membrane protein DedA with SNARE-associated domain
MVDVLGDVLHHLEELSTSPWFYLVILVIAYLDSMIPVVPSETMVILGGVAAGQGDLWLGLVIACALTGAFLGDTTAYLLGRHFGPAIERRFFRRPKSQARLEWARRQLRVRGGMLLVTARFVPGGRTVVTFTSGLTRQPFRRFLGFIAFAAVVWACYAALLGYIGGKAFADNHTLAFLVAFGCALAVTGVIEVIRWIRHHGRPDPLDVLDDAALDGTALDDAAIDGAGGAPAEQDDVSRSS